ncbi:MAG: TetR/AcrR family transcriptional regulator [Cellulomonas sp.]
MSRRQEPADRRRALLAQASAIARDEGLEAVTADHLGRTAGTSKALVFHYFGSVRGLRLAVLEGEVADLLTATSTPPGLEPVERPVAVLVAFLDHVQQRRTLWLEVWRGPLAGDDGARELLEGARLEIVDRMVSIAAGTGQPANPRLGLLARGWIALVEEIAAGWVSGAEVSREEVVDLLLASLTVLVPELPTSSAHLVRTLTGTR